MKTKLKTNCSIVRIVRLFVAPVMVPVRMTPFSFAALPA